jgi:hypothetical protein
MGAWTDTDEVTLREAVAAKHRAVEACWSAERRLRDVSQAERALRGRSPLASLALRGARLAWEEAQRERAMRAGEAAFCVCRMLAARGLPAADGA